MHRALNSLWVRDETNRISTGKAHIQYTVLVILFSFFCRSLWLGHYNLLAEEAYYWNYAQHLDFCYLDHPPMVALLIKASSIFFGTNEFSIRFPSLISWIVMTCFSYKLTNLIARDAGLYSAMLLGILPFFFLQSMVLTPDQPVMTCWSAALYYLYRCLALEDAFSWYKVGIWTGLGLLSKYTIILLAPITLIYLCVIPESRMWLIRKEPYLCAFITCLLFSPVIYWNINHHWISIIFQSSRRLQMPFNFTFHNLVGLLFFFLTPLGIAGLWSIIKKNCPATPVLNLLKTRRFIQLFTLTPLIFFSLFSLSREVKFNWIGPGLLALVPWLAQLIQYDLKTLSSGLYKKWLITGVVLLIGYNSLFLVICFGTPEKIHHYLLRKFIAWERLEDEFHHISQRIQEKTNIEPVIMPLDLYNISSEFLFYQAKFSESGKYTNYSFSGRHIFGGDSLMFRYWEKSKSLAGKTLILISTYKETFDYPDIKSRVIKKSPILSVLSYSQGKELSFPLDPIIIKL